MEEYKNDRKDIVLEGMYNGMAGKLEEVRQSVRKELQYSSAQQVDAYEALAEEYRKGLQTLLAEMRYVSQQSSAIYDYDRIERCGARDAVIEAMQKKLDSAVERLTQYVDEAVTHVKVDYDLLAEKVAVKLKAAEPEVPVAEEPVQEPIRVAASEEPAPAVSSEPVAADAESAQEPAAAAAEVREGASAEPAAETGTFDEAFDYDLLAEKITMGMPETDYDLLADRVAAALPANDENALVDRIVAAINVPDENSLAEHVAETITPTDYDLIAERVTGALEETNLKLHDESIEKIALRVAELLRADESDIDRVAQDALAEENVSDEIAAAAPVAEPEVPAEEPEAPVQPETVAPVVIPEPPEGMMTRYKRSFIAKIIESDEEIKSYYSDLKNALLHYQKASSQVSWTNDRFTLRGETVAKIGIRGKTLCLYVALDPNEFPESTYHQKYAGDTKMYEKTPMMVKIKSKVALKRAVRLIELLMEKNGAVAEETEPVDYVAQYAFRSEEELLAEGLIKTAIVEKSDLDF